MSLFPCHQGAATLASYAWTYESDSSPGVAVSSASDAWLPNGGLPVLEGLSTDAGQGMLPVHDTTGIVAALLAGASTPYTAAGLVSCTSSDGTDGKPNQPNPGQIGQTRGHDTGIDKIGGFW